MENASKALIIAGAILLSILIIAVGMFIFTSSQNSINEGAAQYQHKKKQHLTNNLMLMKVINQVVT